MPSLFRLIALKLFKHVFEYLMTRATPRYPVFTQRLDFYDNYFQAMLVGSVKNASLFPKFTVNLIGFGVCDLGEPIRCYSSLPVSLIET